MIEYIRKSSGTYLYKIPGKYIQSSYITGKTKVIKGQDSWVAQRQITEILKNCCKMTLQQFYDLEELGIIDPKDRPKCMHCGKSLAFSNRLRQGYTHRTTIKTKIFCSRKCLMNYNYEHLGEFKFKGGFKDPKTLAKTARKYFEHQGKSSDKCYFYFAKLNSGRIKLGITKSPQGRIRRSKHDSRGPSDRFIKMVILRSMKRSEIARLEFYAKSLINYSEYIDSMKELLMIRRFVRDY